MVGNSRNTLLAISLGLLLSACSGGASDEQISQCMASSIPGKLITTLHGKAKGQEFCKCTVEDMLEKYSEDEQRLIHENSGLIPSQEMQGLMAHAVQGNQRCQEALGTN
jgi:hypothetical protein